VPSRSTHDFIVLVPLSTNTAYIAVIELSRIKENEPPQSWVRIHRIEWDRMEKHPLKGDANLMEHRLHFLPTHIRINQNDSVVLVYGKKGCLIATMPGHRANESFRKANNGQDRPMQA
jgi:hypothetical protein